MFKSVVIALLLAPFLAVSQEFTFGKLSFEDLHFDRNEIDSTANAVFLNEYGTTRFSFEPETGKMKLIHKYHARIKIFNKEGFSAANIIIPLHKNGTAYDEKERAYDIKASTFNQENGKLEETVMTNKAVFTEDKSKYQALTKFTLPNVKDNSIIEYEYTFESPYLFTFKSWDFQGEFPKLNSTYVAFIPGNYMYNVSLRGYLKLTDNKAEIAKDCLRIAGKDLDCSKLTYSLKNVPAFVEEDYMIAPSNYISAAHFELSEVVLFNGSSKKYTQNWKDVDRELSNNKEFGGQMKRKDVFKDIVPDLIQGENDDLAKAKVIFDYIKKQIKWNNYYGKYSETSVKEVIEKRSGNVADINFALISALSAANLDVEAVILSTRDNPIPNKLYPIMSDFNYVIAKLNIGAESYLLDATDPLLPFGLLPLRCINDQGRVIHLKKPSYWIDLTAGKKSLSTYSLIGEMNADGKITAKLTTYLNGYDALNKRKDIANSSSVDEYVDKLAERMVNIKIKNFKINYVDSVERALSEVYEIEFSAQSAENEYQHFNPFFINGVKKNPFKLNERNYPVDLGAASEERVTIKLILPEQYAVTERPKDLAIALPDKGGRYFLQTEIADRTLAVNQLLAFNKAIYSADEYHYLKEFYNQIIQAQKAEVLISKDK
ncbi:DUF3857 domain-containing protein [Sphingobacterium corticibacter]|uniref:DUF3857 domain-containing protein n=1 Tax=Sphingobacterium corticibacter TaxID=2171749 RepID=A0A2T8HJ09_9SPHI|nr:DUF3857 domain-containing protein [Sphingobacterium corticibacter]PVH25383.1 DUF3857 domain-containing protein [Sphingobacterium corticibacter]